MSHEGKRALVEDALKHLHRTGRYDQPASATTLAQALSVADAEELVGTLLKASLAQWKDGNLVLTSQGRAYARQVIRAHRLYELYLAQYTGHEETEWHRRADVKEHELSEDDVTALARKLGNPAYDPHGDPIPTADGKVPPARGAMLPAYPSDTWVEVVHVEDEPVAVYQELASFGVCPGIRLRLVETGGETITLEVDGREQTISRTAALNVHAIPVSTTTEDASRETVPLSTLSQGDRGRVYAISPRCRGAERRRLLDLGIVPGTEIEAELRSPSGDPTAYRVRQTLVALRAEQAGNVHVVPMERTHS